MVLASIRRCETDRRAEQSYTTGEWQHCCPIKSSNEQQSGLGVGGVARKKEEEARKQRRAKGNGRRLLVWETGHFPDMDGSFKRGERERERVCVCVCVCVCV